MMTWDTTLKCIMPMTAFAAASRWSTSPQKLNLVNNQINCVYRFEDQENRGFYLRLTHETIRSLQELEAALDFQQHLVKSNVPVCAPVYSQNGNLIESIDQDELSFFAHVCEEVPGQVVNLKELPESAYFIWGTALAELHRASQTYHPKLHRFKSWEVIWQETTAYIKTEEDSEVQKAYKGYRRHWWQNLRSDIKVNITMIKFTVHNPSFNAFETRETLVSLNSSLALFSSK